MKKSDTNLLSNWRVFFDKFNKESPRGVVLISFIYLDDLLKELIINHAAINNQKKVISKLFDLGPLSRFTTKIKLAYEFDLINEKNKSDLQIFQTIRNKFAHEIFEISFENKEIENLCKQLNSAEIITDQYDTTPENIFRISSAMLMSRLALTLVGQRRQK